MNYQKRQGILQAAEEIPKEIVLNETVAKPVWKILARISGKMITRFLDLWTEEKVNEIYIWTTDRHTVGKLPCLP